MMQAFQVKDDTNRIYFKNYEKIPAEQELSMLIKELKDAGCRIGNGKKTGLDDLYEGWWDGMAFTIVFTGEEAFIYSESGETIDKMMGIFK